MALFRFGRRRPKAPKNATGPLDGAPHSVVQVNLSIHDTPHHDDRIGEALCMVAPGAHIAEATGAVVPIMRHPNRLSRDDFAQLINQAATAGHLLDGFLEVEASVDINSGEMSWQPENGIGVELVNLEAIVENTFAALIETNLFGEWFVPTSVTRRLAVVEPESNRR